MKFDSEKERHFYDGMMETNMSDQLFVRATLRHVLQNVDGNDFWYSLGGYTMYLAAGGEPFLDQLERDDTE